jgi:hypothetical protein
MLKEYIEWMTPKMVANKVEDGGYEIAQKTQAHYRMDNKIPYHKVGKFIRYKRSELNAWIENHKVC